LPEEFVWITGLRPLVNDRPLNLDGKEGSSSAPPPPSKPGAPPAKPAITALALTGLYLENPRSQDVVFDFAKSLEKSPFFKFNYQSDQKSIVPKAENPSDKTWAYSFEMKLPLATSLALP
jgi:hypothetical protein